MQKLLVIDFGSQYTHLITSRFRHLGIFTEIIPALDDLQEKDLEGLRKEIKNGNLKGIILSGGPNSVYDKDTLTLPKEFFELGVPILAICYGHQLTHQVNGGEIKGGDTQEYGEAKLKIDLDSKLFEGFKSDEIVVWMSHGDSVVKMAKGFKNIGKTLECEVGATESIPHHNTLLKEREHNEIYTLQFHPEVTHTQNGIKILENFAKICEIEKQWSMEKFLKSELEELKKQIGEKNVFLFISGGVDSTVAYFLINKAIGADRIYPVFVDTGFMRKNEARKVEKLLSTAGVKNLQIVDAKKEFLKDLKGITDPEIKRKIIGNKFIEIQARITKNLGLDTKNWLLAQGTIYPDTIESGGTKNAQTIKTHHNRVPEIQAMIEEGLIVEPLEKLYKDEVREIGKLLGISDELIFRHPFPGPGLSLRILCNNLPHPNPLLQEKEQKKIQKFVGGNFKVKVLPVKSVGVQGDNRSYKHPVSLSLIHQTFLLQEKEQNGSPSPAGEGVRGGGFWDKLNKLSTSITNNFSSVNRVLLNLNSITPPSQPSPFQEEGVKSNKLELQKGFLTEDRINLLQEIDEIVENFLIEKGYQKKIWQFPVVLIPLGKETSESIVLRPIDSIEAMTATFSRIDIKDLKSLVKEILKNTKIQTVFYDLTGKPPGTIEWE